MTARIALLLNENRFSGHVRAIAGKATIQFVSRFVFPWISQVFPGFSAVDKAGAKLPLQPENICQNRNKDTHALVS